MRTRILLWLASMLLLCGAAEAALISRNEALKLAEDAIVRHQSGMLHAPSLHDFELIYESGEYYVFSTRENGWAVVSADNRVPQAVLAYSPCGTFDIKNVPDAVRYLLDIYAGEVQALDTESIIVAPTQASGKTVEPLLGETAWSQGAPFNRMCPIVDGHRCVTGCVNTAISQIMYYHRYPSQGRGSHSYEFNGGVLSADFSQSVYRWDLMKPVYSYDGAEDSEESKDAVALLMKDCGIANSSSYTPSETGASLNDSGLVEYFGYDKSIRYIERTQCTREYFEETLRDELDAGRPVYYEGGSPQGAHAFVCDGYNDEGYFHFNFGWGPGSSGYYLTSATGFDSSPGIYCSIMPDAGNEAGITGGSPKDFAWVEGNLFTCDIYIRIACGVASTVEAGLEIADKATGLTRYIITHTFNNSIYAEVHQMVLDDAIADGDYRLRPVCRANDGEWKHVTFADMRTSYVDLNVNGGVRTYSNEVLEDDMDPDVERIDGVYYRIDGDRAVVTQRNSRGNSYSGDVVIPAMIHHGGRSIPVEVIGESSFEECKLNSLKVGANVKTIAFGAFSLSNIGTIEFDEPSGLREIEGWGFNGVKIGTVVLPHGLTSLGTCTFQSCSMTKLSLPASVTFLGKSAFNYCTSLQDIYVQWREASSLPRYGETPFNGCEKPQINLHVPVGAKAIYAAHPEWGEFNIIEDQGTGIDNITGHTLIVSVVDDGIVINGMPEGCAATVYDINGGIVAVSDNGVIGGLGHGVYIVRAGLKVVKVVI